MPFTFALTLQFPILIVLQLAFNLSNAIWPFCVVLEYFVIQGLGRKQPGLAMGRGDCTTKLPSLVTLRACGLTL